MKRINPGPTLWFFGKMNKGQPKHFGCPLLVWPFVPIKVLGGGLQDEPPVMTVRQCFPFPAFPLPI
jgi:hypothetical protein